MTYTIDDLFWYAEAYLLNAKHSGGLPQKYYVSKLELYVKLIENILRDPILP